LLSHRPMHNNIQPRKPVFTFYYLVYRSLFFIKRSHSSRPNTKHQERKILENLINYFTIKFWIRKRQESRKQSRLFQIRPLHINWRHKNKKYSLHMYVFCVFIFAVLKNITNKILLHILCLNSSTTNGTRLRFYF
jgi:hypothetical protein